MVGVVSVYELVLLRQYEVLGVSILSIREHGLAYELYESRKVRWARRLWVASWSSPYHGMAVMGPEYGLAHLSYSRKLHQRGK